MSDAHDLISRKAAIELRDRIADIIGAAPLSSIHSALCEYANSIAALPSLDVQPAPDVVALSALIVSVENGTAMNADFADAFPPIGPSKPYWTGTSAYNNGSLDAAKGFHNALLPGWDVQISTYEDDTFEASVSEPLNVKTYDGISPCMARAWLIAALRAALARKGGDA